MKLTKAELEKENTEFKKRHKKLLKANQDSMERRVELSTANSNLLSENEALKSTIEDLQKELYTLHRKLNEAKFLLHQYRAENENQGYKIEELTRRIEGLQIPTPQPKLTFFQQLKELFK